MESMPEISSNVSNRPGLWRLDAWTVAIGLVNGDKTDLNQVAGPGVRCLAGLIDLGIQFAVAIAMAGWAAVQAPDLVPQGAGWWFYPSAALEWHVLYYILFEAFTGGSTPGKRLMMIHVINCKTSGKIGPWQSIARNLARVIDMLPFAYFAALTSMFCGRSRQRLGDRAARTTVVSLLSLPLQLESARVTESLYAATPDGYMLESYLQRRVCMDPALAEGLDRKVAFWFHQEYDSVDQSTTQAWLDHRYVDYLQALYLHEKKLAGHELAALGGSPDHVSHQGLPLQ